MNSDEQAHSVPTLTDLVRQQDPRIPHLVLLRAGSASPPLFMTHGMGGDVIGILPLALGIRVASPIYGMQARGIDGLEEPHDRIEDMAEYHLASIRQVQPHGPYFLIGYSLGGLVMLEIARRLSGDGEKIALLVMLDSYPHRSHLPFGQHARLALRLAKRRALSLMRGRAHSHPSRVGEQSKQHAGQQHPSVEWTAQRMQRVSEYQDRALKNYRPQFYDGKIRFVKAAMCSYFPDNPVAVWGPLVKECTLESVPCDHAGMLTTHIETVASMVTRFIEEAVEE
jgi:acetoacetyl-CoA synthetase